MGHRDFPGDEMIGMVRRKQLPASTRPGMERTVGSMGLKYAGFRFDPEIVPLSVEVRLSARSP